MYALKIMGFKEGIEDIKMQLRPKRKSKKSRVS